MSNPGASSGRVLSENLRPVQSCLSRLLGTKRRFFQHPRKLLDICGRGLVSVLFLTRWKVTHGSAHLPFSTDQPLRSSLCR
jgi:hypothetical protein